MTVRALLVYPELPPTYWSMKYALPFIGKKASIPPLGLLTVAALLPEDCDVTLVDMNVERLRESAVSAADVVLTSSMIVQKESHERVVRLCNKLGKPVVAGGPYPSSGHERIEGVDHFVLNEAEVTLPPFLADFERAERGTSTRTGPARPRPHAPAAFRPRQAEEVLVDGPPVLPGLPPLVRVLRHHRALRAPAPDEDRGPVPERADAPLRRGTGEARSSSWTTTSSAT